MLECLFGFALLLLVVMLVMTGFPTATQASARAARLEGAHLVARQALERGKQKPITEFSDSVDGEADLDLQHNGKTLMAHYAYRTERVESVSGGDDPICLRTTVRWDLAGREQSLVLLGAVSPP